MSFILNPSRFSTGGGADPGLTLLQSATLWLDASDAVSGAQWLRNKGTGGRALDARVGSVGSAQIINGALKLPGVSNNNASAPDSAALSVTGDIDIMARVAPLDWTPATQGLIAGKWGSTTGLQAYGLFLDTAGTLRFVQYSGAAYNDLPSTVATGFTDGEAKWVRATYSASGGTVKFYTAPDASAVPSSWTQLGTTVSGVARSTQDTTNSLVMGESSSAGSNLVAGSLYRVRILNGYDGAGSVVFDADFTAQSTLATSFTESSSNAATVTINSTTGVDTNDPLLLTHTGTNYLYLPGVAGNNADTPDSAALDITGDLEIIARIRLESASANGEIVSKWQASSFAYTLRQNSGNIEFYISTGGSDFSNSVTAAHGQSVGTTFWLRATRVQSTGVMTLWTAADSTSIPSSWTSIGSQTRTTSNIFTNTNVVRVGQDSASGLPWNGSVFRAIIRNAIGSGTQFDADFTANTNQSSFTESSSNAATVTINRSASGRKAVMVVRPTLLFGTDDYLEVADNALLDMGSSQDFTVIATRRTFATWASDDRLVSKRNNAGGLGYVLANAGSTDLAQFYIQHGGGGVADTQTPYTVGTYALQSGVRSGSDITCFIGSTGSSTAGSSADLSNAVALRVGADPDGANFLDGEITHVAVFRSALTSSELGQIATYLGV